jgi:hypothetical protein
MKPNPLPRAIARDLVVQPSLLEQENTIVSLMKTIVDLDPKVDPRVMNEEVRMAMAMAMAMIMS